MADQEGEGGGIGLQPPPLNFKNWIKNRETERREQQFGNFSICLIVMLYTCLLREKKIQNLHLKPLSPNPPPLPFEKDWIRGSTSDINNDNDN